MARTKNISFETAGLLAEEGIPFAIQSGYESYVPKTRNILFEAAIAVANGLDFDRSLEAITLSPAKILKIEDRVGSIEAGKDADIVVFDGDPFEYTSHVCQVLIGGELIKSECR
jgi:imidazolonepropionase-like amidohydrolase